MKQHDSMSNNNAGLYSALALTDRTAEITTMIDLASCFIAT